MSAVRAAAALNTQILSSLQPPLHVVVGGGTSGIGRGIALAYRKHCPDAHVTIIGRNQSAADEILSQLGSNGNFIRADLSLMSEIRRITKQINAVDVLVLSQGILALTGRTPTKENIDDKAAVTYYGRVLFVEELLPLLRSSPHGGKVLFVLNSKRGNPSKINWNDMALEKNYSFLAGLNQVNVFTDLVIQYLASQPENANVSFIHAFPGTVRTPIAHGLPFYVRLPVKALNALGWGISPEDCAEFMIHGILGTEKGWRCIDEKGETVPNKEVSNEEMLKKVWEHTCEITSRTAQ
jgi:NAD(P)-dependent dehydrogenase (short-subunit alcohol dehydrogenase family)